MSNFSPRLEDAMDEQLMHMVNELDFCVVPLTSDELTRWSIRKTIEVSHNRSSKQTEKMVKFTW